MVVILGVVQAPADDAYLQLVWGDELTNGPINTTNWDIKHNCDGGGPNKPVVKKNELFLLIDLIM